MQLLLSHHSHITTQGASDDGRLPLNAEVPLVAAVFVLREAIYAFPDGGTKNEYHQWVLRMNDVTVSLKPSRALPDSQHVYSRHPHSR